MSASRGIKLLLGLSLLQAACRSEMNGAEEKSGPDLLQIARDRGIGRPSEQNMFLYSFARGGIRREALVLTPGAVFEVTPFALGDETSVRLWVGMPFQLGDGAELIAHAMVGGHPAEVARLSIDPIHKRQDRQWLSLQFPIPNQTTSVRFTVSPGPAGDGIADWVGIAPFRK
jgi:hypothetical protein